MDVRTTMFLVGNFAETFPKIVKAIHVKGHEIGSHRHVEIFKQSPAELREDVRRTKAYLEDLTGEDVRGYQAPWSSTTIIMSSTLLNPAKSSTRFHFRISRSIYS